MLQDLPYQQVPTAYFSFCLHPPFGLLHLLNRWLSCCHFLNLMIQMTTKMKMILTNLNPKIRCSLSLMKWEKAWMTHCQIHHAAGNANVKLDSTNTQIL